VIFSCKNWEKLREVSVTTSEIQGVIRTEYIPNIMVEQEFKYFPNLLEPYQDSRRQKGEITLVSH
jgi:hypothetical protein